MMLRIVIMTLVFAVVIACGAGAYALYSGGSGGSYTSSNIGYGYGGGQTDNGGYGFGNRGGDDDHGGHGDRRRDDD